jgi:2-polyprenyl-6-methoxyphenol hydroxylase-like FAD-dependent oxidoreductase
MHQIDVLIAGAGPTGLTLACDLARRGVACRVVEQSAEPAQGTRGFTLKPRTLEAFDDLGIIDRILHVSHVESRTRFHLGPRLLFDLDVAPAPTRPSRPYPNAVGLPQWRTEAILRDRLVELGGQVEFGHRVADFTVGPDGVSVIVENGEQTETVRARCLVGADGGRSQVRRVLGLPFHGSTDEDARALLADVRLHGLDPDDGVQLWMGGDGLVVARPVPHTDTWEVVASLAPGPDGQWPEPSLGVLQNIVAVRTARRDIVLEDPSWLSAWRYNLRMVDTYRVGPVLLAGDAAHVHSPFGGHGMNTGIQDAYNLGWKLALVLQGAAEDGLLDTYQTERLPVGQAILADSDRRMPRRMPPSALRLLLRLILKPMFARQQRAIRNDHPTYPASPLTMHHAGRRGAARAGDPAPDALIEISGRPGRLFDVLRGPHFTVLVFAPAPNLTDDAFGPYGHVYAVTASDDRRPDGGRTLIDRTGQLRRAYGAHAGTVVVIRPDGYIGLMAHSAAEQALADYHHRIGLRTTARTSLPHP